MRCRLWMVRVVENGAVLTLKEVESAKKRQRGNTKGKPEDPECKVTRTRA